MVNEAAAHAARLDSYKERYGLDRVEHLMDIAFALDRHIDFHKGLYRKPYPPRQVVEIERTEQPYDDLHEKAGYSIEKRVVGDRFPPHQEADLLWFLDPIRPVGDVGTGCPQHGSRRSPLLLPAIHDENPQRRLGIILACGNHARCMIN